MEEILGVIMFAVVLIFIVAGVHIEHMCSKCGKQDPNGYHRSFSLDPPRLTYFCKMEAKEVEDEEEVVTSNEVIDKLSSFKENYIKERSIN